MIQPIPEHADFYEQLLRSEGWQLMDEWLGRQIEDCVEAATRSTEPYLTAKALGMAAAFKLMHQRPQILLQTLRQGTLQQD